MNVAGVGELGSDAYQGVCLSFPHSTAWPATTFKSLKYNTPTATSRNCHTNIL